MNVISKILLSSIIGVFIVFCTNVYAQEEKQYDSTHLTREELTEILRSGDILGLDSILHVIKKQDDDRILEIELVHYGELLVYKIEILQSNGVVLNYFLDGKTGQDITNILE